MTSRRGHAKSRPLPRTREPDLPDRLKRLTSVALVGTISAPIGSSLTAVYLAAAKALIHEAQRIAMEGP